MTAGEARVGLAERTRPTSGAKICVGIATRGRPAQVNEVVARLRRQTLPPTIVLVACCDPADAQGLPPGANLKILIGEAGLTKQRNAVLRNTPEACDIVVFFDDDFLPDDRWLEIVAKEFERDPTLACVTGNVVADGILGPGLTSHDAEAALGARDAGEFGWRIADYSPYGCNMAFRTASIAGLEFDERLVLYGWLEDRDFGARVAQRGGMAKIGGAVGVHLGVKKGRVSGRRLGYSQIVNPIYMCRKGTMQRPEAAKSMVKNVLANLAKSVWPEPYIDRRGRLLGNLLAATDLLRGRCEPEKAERL